MNYTTFYLFHQEPSAGPSSSSEDEETTRIRRKRNRERANRCREKKKQKLDALLQVSTCYKNLGNGTPRIFYDICSEYRYQLH